MERQVDISEISDGRKYHINDMVKIGCNDCNGCNQCCENMDNLITLDPYDVYRMVSGMEGMSFEKLLNDRLSFTVDRGVMVPVLKMDAESGKCAFIRDDGRCSIHNIRPGICRLFPMGRLYENAGFYYFLQKDECPYPNKTKVKLKNWLDTPEIQRYEKYISDWHYFIRDIQEYMKTADDEEARQINSVLLKIFFTTPYADGFYDDFYIRLEKVKGLI